MQNTTLYTNGTKKQNQDLIDDYKKAIALLEKQKTKYDIAYALDETSFLAVGRSTHYKHNLEQSSKQFLLERRENTISKLQFELNQLVEDNKPSYNDHPENCECEDCQEWLSDYNQRNNTTY